MAKHDLWLELMKGGKTAAPIQLRTTPAMKLRIQSTAKAQNLSMTGLIEKLLINEFERMDNNEQE